jgi:hypothetical protein
VFSSREIAVAMWGAAFLAFSLTNRGVREAFGHLLRSAFQRKIIVPVIAATIYVVAIVLLLNHLGVWTVDLAKDTALWFVFGGLASFSLITSHRGESLLKSAATDALKIAVLVEYITSTYTLSLPAELLLVPVATVVAMMDVVAGTDENFAPVRRLLRVVQIAIGITILYVAGRKAVADFGGLWTVGTPRSLALAPVLSILFVPFVYSLLLYAKYDALFVRLKIGAEKPADVQRYAKRRLIAHLGASLKRVTAFLAGHGADLMRIRTRQDVDALLSAVRLHRDEGSQVID